MNDAYRCGLVALVGRPNVGKSTLLNHLLGQKISITSRKPQTTRHRITGILSRENGQLIFVDTPGIHDSGGNALNRYMNKTALASLSDVDVVVMVIEALCWTEQDEQIISALQNISVPVILALNKLDSVSEKQQLLPFIAELSERKVFAEIVPLSALRNDNLETLEAEIRVLLPDSSPMFPEDQITDRSVRFLVAEIIREKLTRQLGQELPYASTVMIEEFEETDKLVRISAAILVERSGQKAIVIGKGGERMKKIGQAARIDIERLLDARVHLNLWVKVRSGWSDDQRALNSLGYDDNR